MSQAPTNAGGLELRPIQLAGLAVDGLATSQGAEIAPIIESTRTLYARRGFAPPWICYLALLPTGQCVGTCGFTGPPREGRVEIAYHTFPAFAGRGWATRMAELLARLARQADSSIEITAHTLPAKSASTTILRKLGFRCEAEVNHPEDGRVWLWVRLR